jgi:hypothetical protein
VWWCLRAKRDALEAYANAFVWGARLTEVAEVAQRDMSFEGSPRERYEMRQEMSRELRDRARSRDTNIVREPVHRERTSMERSRASWR